MKTTNTFGVHFTLRKNKPLNGKFPIYARITVNKTRCELALKYYLYKEDWNSIRGIAKPKTEELKQLNSYLEEVKARITYYYRNFEKNETIITAELLKSAYLGIVDQQKQKTLNELMTLHNNEMKNVLKPGTMKNYFATARYLKIFMKNKYPSGDVYLRQLNYEFIATFEQYIRSHPMREGDPCTQNGLMKHMERLKRVANWAYKMQWIPQHPFLQYKLKFKRTEREFLTEAELTELENQQLMNPSLQQVKDMFIFSCYTGLAYCDLMDLSPDQIAPDMQNRFWIYTSRIKSEIKVAIPLLKPAIEIREKYKKHPGAQVRGKAFPYLTNQEVNRQLKLIAEGMGIKKHLTFHLARHTFATMLLTNNVPIETIKKLMGHTKITTTMIYAHVVNTKLAADMDVLQQKLEAKKQTKPLFKFKVI